MNRILAFWVIALLAGSSISARHTEQSSGPQASPSGSKRIQRTPQELTQRVLQSYGKLPLTFEANFGQADPAVKFLARGRGYGLFLTSTEAVLVVNAGNSSEQRGGKKPRDHGAGPGRRNRSEGTGGSSPTMLRMRLVGADANALVQGLETSTTLTNYLIGNDPAKWRRNVPSFGRVEFDGIYPGIKLAYYGSQRELKYDFIVAPGFSPDAIRFAFDGVDGLEVNARGELLLNLPGGQIRHHKPVIYQHEGGARKAITGRYSIFYGNEAGFHIGAYDASKPLIIDPVMDYSTYLGGSFYDSASAMSVDHVGNAYVAGTTVSTDFPVTPGVLQPAYSHGPVFKTTDEGNTWSPKSRGLPPVEPAFVHVDPTRPAIVYAGFHGSYPNALFKTTDGGSTWSGTGSGLPSNSSSLSSLVFDPVVHSTLYLGTSNGIYKSTDEGANWARISTGLPSNLYVYDLAIDPSNPATLYAALYFYGVYKSTNGGVSWAPATLGLPRDVQALSVDPTNSNTVYAGTTRGFYKTTNGGGNWTAGNVGLTYTHVDYTGTYTAIRWINHLAVDPVNPAVLYAAANGGIFKSTNRGDSWTSISGGLPSNQYDYYFIVLVNPANPSILFARRYGSGVYRTTDGGNQWALANTGLPFFVGGGSTLAMDPSNPSTLYVPVGASSGDAFVTKLNGTGDALLYSTYLGGSNGSDSPTDIAIDSLGNAYMTGMTSASNFPTTPGAFKTTFDGDSYRLNIFVAKLDPNGSQLLYSTFLGVSTCCGGDYGPSLTIDAAGSAHVTGSEVGSDFPTTPGAFRTTITAPSPGYQRDSFVLKLNPAGSALAYSTFLTGSPGSYATGIALDSAGNAYVTGETSSTELPVSPGAFQETFNDGPVFKSTSAGTQWNAANRGLSGEAHAIVVDPGNPSTLYTLTTWGVYKSLDRGRNWLKKSNGLPPYFFGYYYFSAASRLVIDRTNPSTLYALLDGLYKTTDGGETWNQLPAATFGSTSAFVIDPVTSSTLYLSYYSRILKSTDGGANWSLVSTGSTGYIPGEISCLAVDPVTPTTLYAGTLYSGIYKSTDGGVSWSAVNSGVPTTIYASYYASIGGLLIHPANPSTIYATIPFEYVSGGGGRGIYKSTNAGASWAAMNVGLTDLDVGDLTIDPTNTAVLYASSSQVYKTLDGAASWAPLSNNGLSTYGYQINALAIDPANSSVLYLGTRHGDGDAFSLKLNASGTAMVHGTYLGGSNYDAALDLVLDSARNVHLHGYTESPGFPVTPGAYQSEVRGGDTFVAKMNDSASSVRFSTLLGGGNSWEWPAGIALDALGNVFVTGYVASTDFPVTVGAFQTTHGGGGYDAYLSMLNPTGTALVSSTFLGGSNRDFPSDIAVDLFGNPYVVGSTSSIDFPTTPDSFQSSFSSSVFFGGHSFVAKLHSVLTPHQAAETLIGSINDLVTRGVLSSGHANSLISKLRAAMQQMDRGNRNAAVNLLQAFINEVNALIGNGSLPAAEGQLLLDAANQMMAKLGA